mmetsp:Transcript_36868/g.85033  ORF Transcript_36868/g.85033 Transcript_36868/m.85033 type:complete len:883 (-) Transcript_36868:156-2804(-)
MIEVESIGSFNLFDIESEDEAQTGRKASAPQPRPVNGSKETPVNGSEDACKLPNGSQRTSPPTYTFAFEPVQRVPSAFQAQHPAVDESCESISSIDQTEDLPDLLAELEEAEEPAQDTDHMVAQDQHEVEKEDDDVSLHEVLAEVKRSFDSSDDSQGEDGVVGDPLPAQEKQSEADASAELAPKQDMEAVPARTSSFATATSERGCEGEPDLASCIAPETETATQEEQLAPGPAARSVDGKVSRSEDHVEAALDVLACGEESSKSMEVVPGDQDPVPETELDLPPDQPTGEQQPAGEAPGARIEICAAQQPTEAHSTTEDAVPELKDAGNTAAAAEDAAEGVGPAATAASEDPTDHGAEIVNNLDSLFEEVAQMPAQGTSVTTANHVEQIPPQSPSLRGVEPVLAVDDAEQVQPKSPDPSSAASSPRTKDEEKERTLAAADWTKHRSSSPRSTLDGEEDEKPLAALQDEADARLTTPQQQDRADGSSWDSRHSTLDGEEEEKPAVVNQDYQDEIEKSLTSPPQQDSLQVTESDATPAKQELQTLAVSEARDDDSVSVMDIQEVQESTKERFYELFSKTSNGAARPETIIVGKETGIEEREAQHGSDQLLNNAPHGEAQRGEMDPIMNGVKVQLPVADADESSLRLAGAEASPPMLGFDERAEENAAGTDLASRRFADELIGPSAPDVEPPGSPPPGPPALSDSGPCLTAAIGSPDSEDPCVCFSTMQNLDAHAVAPPPIYSVDQDISEDSDSSSGDESKTSPTTEDNDEDDGSDSCEPLVRPPVQEQVPVAEVPEDIPPPPPPEEVDPPAPPAGAEPEAASFADPTIAADPPINAGTVMPPHPRPPVKPAESDAKKSKASSNPLASFTKCLGCLKKDRPSYR